MVKMANNLPLGLFILVSPERKIVTMVTFDVTYIQSFLFFEKVFSPFKKLIQSFFLLLSVFQGVIFFYSFKSVKSHWLYNK